MQLEEKLKEYYRKSYKFVSGNSDIYTAANVNLNVGGTQGTLGINSQIAATLAYFSAVNLLDKLGNGVTYADLCRDQILKGKRILDLGSGSRSYFARTVVPMGAHVTSIDLAEYEDYGPVKIAIGNGECREDREIMSNNHQRIVGDLNLSPTLDELRPMDYDMITSSYFIIFRTSSSETLPLSKEWWENLHTKLKIDGLSFHDEDFPNSTELGLGESFWIKR
ncbi:TPA: hypothetical protein HA246_00200 [Candidatus Woesearchaeota archaeon]|nr:hypothetical protein [Candidatus Woesearchaeota archaeon]